MNPVISEEAVYENVPVLKFVENRGVVVFLKGGPNYAELKDNEKLPNSKVVDEFGTVQEQQIGPDRSLYHIAAFPGTTATIKMMKKEIRYPERRQTHVSYYYEAYNVKLKEF